MRLLFKFSLIFVIVFGLGLTAAGYLFYGTLQRNAREQVLYNAQLMMDTALAMRHYTETNVKPALQESLPQARDPAQRASDEDVFRDLCAKHKFIGKQVFHLSRFRRSRPRRSLPSFARTTRTTSTRRRHRTPPT